MKSLLLRELRLKEGEPESYKNLEKKRKIHKMITIYIKDGAY
tara:strand:+ start:709 stop:834 length:126 start_codon:yes stop_codon:yes gene_type:complete